MTGKLATSALRAALPGLLRSTDAWVGHRAKKPLLLPHGRKPAKTNTPETWRPLEDALRFYERTHADPAAGIGFVLRSDLGVVFLDFDHCLAEDGTLLPWAAPLLEPFRGTFIERSLSGRGLHVLCLGSMERAATLTPPNATERGHIELYNDRRFVAITGDRYDAAPDTLLRKQEEIDALLAKFGAKPARTNEPRQQEIDVARVRDALFCLDPDLPYEKWLRVGMALKAGLGDAGLELWDEWSADGASYKAGEPAAKWASFQGSGVTIATVFAMAQEPVWTPTDPQPEAREEFEPFDGPDYHTELSGRGKNATPVFVRSAKNIAELFAKEKGWRGRLRWNARTNEAELDGKPLADIDLVDLADAASRFFQWDRSGATKEATFDGVRSAAHADQYDPVRDWLAGLRWDGTPRLDGLADRVGLENNAATRRYLRRWMIGAVARAYRPGCEMQNMLVFVGAQGARKSRLIKRLAVKPEWYRESEVRMGDKDGQLAVLAPWIIEMGELAGMSKAEVDRVKVFVSEADSRFRRPYGQLDERHPRRCVFAGTTNNEQYLRDQTGARRFWSVAVAADELRLPEADEVAQLWAEARVAFDAGERWWEEGAELRETLERGEERRVETTLDVEVERLAAELAPKGATTMQEMLEILRARRVLSGGHEPTSSIGHALKRAGWRSRKTKLDGKTWRVWVAPGTVAGGNRDAEVLAFRRVSAGEWSHDDSRDAPGGASGGGSGGVSGGAGGGTSSTRERP